MDSIKTLLSAYGVTDPSTAAASVITVPIDFSSIEGALKIHIADDALRIRATSEVMLTRQSLHAAAVAAAAAGGHGGGHGAGHGGGGGGATATAVAAAPAAPKVKTWQEVVLWIVGVLLSLLMITTFVLVIVMLNRTATTEELDANYRASKLVTENVGKQTVSGLTKVVDDGNAKVTKDLTKVVDDGNAKVIKETGEAIDDAMESQEKVIKAEGAKIRWHQHLSDEQMAKRLEKLEAPNITVKVLK